MKTFTTAIMAAAVALPVLAQEVQHKVEIKKIETRIQQTPRYEVDGIEDKPFDPRYWLEIEAELEIDTTDPTGFVPELETRWFAIVRQTTVAKGEKPKNVMLTGEVTFRDLRAKDGEAHLIAFIGPDTLEKLTGEVRPREGDIEAVAVTVSGPGVLSDGSRAKGLEKATAKEDARWWAAGLYETLNDLIVAKSKTPFAPLWTDRHPAERAE